MKHSILTKMFLSLIVFGLLSIPQALGDVAMVKLSLSPSTWVDPEEFPPSRFGSPPNPALGSAGLTGMTGANRGPASVAPRSQHVQTATRSDLNKMAIPGTGTQEVALIAGDYGFFPKTLFVTRDVPVKLFVTGASKRPLCVMMDSFQVRKQVRSQKVEEVDFTPTSPGMFRFYCPINGMEGTLFVKDPSTQGAS